MTTALTYDYALVGGGLANGLACLALRLMRPHARVVLVEKDAALGGNHTWSFHGTDVPSEARELLALLRPHRWESYDVQFPDFHRTIALEYGSFDSRALASAIEKAAADSDKLTILRGREAIDVTKEHVRLSDGQNISARMVVDARGPERHAPPAGTGFQKFVGLEIQFDAPHGLERPILMDATVPQVDGFRFFYVLPLDPVRALVEDTRFSNASSLDPERLRSEVLAYVAKKGLRVARILRHEQGILPMPWSDPLRQTLEGAAVQAGYAAGHFHPTTGYSFPIALRFALTLANHSPEDFSAKQEDFARGLRKQQRLLRLLNWLMFKGMPPAQRWNVLSRFYRQPVATIGRFYSAQLSLADGLRLFSGRPPRGIFSTRSISSLEAQT